MAYQGMFTDKDCEICSRLAIATAVNNLSNAIRKKENMPEKKL